MANFPAIMVTFVFGLKMEMKVVMMRLFVYRMISHLVIIAGIYLLSRMLIRQWNRLKRLVLLMIVF